MNIIVTGSSRGIGYELVRRFSEVAGNKILALSRDAAKLDRLVRECSVSPAGSTVKALPFDLTDFPSIRKALIPEIQKSFDRLDILVNNAGCLVRKPFADLDPEEFSRCMEVNYLAPVLIIQSLLPLLRESNAAHVVNIGSMAGVEGSKKFPGLSAYSASKAALHSVTECLAEELRDEGIVFNSLALGSVQTEMLAIAFPGLKPPLTARDMADLIADFSVKGRRFYNGKTIQVSFASP